MSFTGANGNREMWKKTKSKKHAVICKLTVLWSVKSTSPKCFWTTEPFKDAPFILNHDYLLSMNLLTSGMFQTCVFGAFDNFCCPFSTFLKHVAAIKLCIYTYILSVMFLIEYVDLQIVTFCFTQRPNYFRIMVVDVCFGIFVCSCPSKFICVHAHYEPVCDSRAAKLMLWY